MADRLGSRWRRPDSGRPDADLGRFPPLELRPLSSHHRCGLGRAQWRRTHTLHRASDGGAGLVGHHDPWVGRCGGHDAAAGEAALGRISYRCTWEGIRRAHISISVSPPRPFWGSRRLGSWAESTISRLRPRWASGLNRLPSSATALEAWPRWYCSGVAVYICGRACSGGRSASAPPEPWHPPSGLERRGRRGWPRWG